MSLRSVVLPALGVGAVAALAVAALTRPPLDFAPGEPLWREAVRGSAGGRIRGEALLELPGAWRRGARTLSLAVESEGEGRPVVVVALPGSPEQIQRVGPEGTALFAIPAADEPGLRLRIRAGPESEPLRVTAAALSPRPGVPWGAAVAGVLAAGLAAALLSRAPAGLGLPLSLWLAGAGALAWTPLLLLWSLPSPAGLLRLLPALALLGSAVGLGARRPGFARASLLIAAFVFGAWVRLYFLPAAGGWDADYWKAIAAHAAEHGFTRVYGNPDDVPPGHFLDQLQGREPIALVEGFGREFVVDQPPGIQMAWAGSWSLVRRAGVLSYREGQNVAAKLPATAGDLLAVAVLLWAFREKPWRGAALAALYWALPVSWLSSAVLGYFDGAQAPLAVAALVAGGRGRSALAGGLLAAAALVKATALITAPAVALALLAARVSLKPAFAAGLGVVAVALLPFALEGTLDSAVIHVYRILFQERLSGGFANLWWLASHLLSLGSDGRVASDAIPFVRIEALPFPARPVGVALFAAVALFALHAQRGRAGARVACLAGSSLILAYAMVAIGVHENHPHALYLTLLATGVGSMRLAVLTGTLFATDVLNMLCLSGIGRFYGLRHVALEPWVARIESLRLAAGFDLTLLLAGLNLAVFGAWLYGLRREMRRLDGTDAALIQETT